MPAKDGVLIADDVDFQFFSFGPHDHVFCAPALAIPKCNKCIGRQSHVSVSLGACGSAILAPFCRMQLNLQIVLLGESFAQRIGPLGIARNNDHIALLQLGLQIVANFLAKKLIIAEVAVSSDDDFEIFHSFNFVIQRYEISLEFARIRVTISTAKNTVGKLV